MAQHPIAVGTAPDDGTGDPLRAAFQKLNDDIAEIYASLGGAPQLPAWTFSPGAYTSGAVGSGLFKTDNANVAATTAFILSASVLGDPSTWSIPSGLVVTFTNASGVSSKFTFSAIIDAGGNPTCNGAVCIVAGEVSWSGRYTVSFLSPDPAPGGVLPGWNGSALTNLTAANLTAGGTLPALIAGGHQTFAPDNTYDIGESAGHRPRAIYCYGFECSYGNAVLRYGGIDVYDGGNVRQVHLDAASGLVMAAGMPLTWYSGAGFAGGPDLSLLRVGAGQLALRSGALDQTLSLGAASGTGGGVLVLHQSVSAPTPTAEDVQISFDGATCTVDKSMTAKRFLFDVGTTTGVNGSIYSDGTHVYYMDSFGAPHQLDQQV